MEQMYLGESPCEEDCAQVGSPNYYERAMRELRAYRAQLIRQHGEPPAGARYKITRNGHDFGDYHAVEILFDEKDEAATAYAFKVEADMPGEWDAEARAELGLAVEGE